MARNWTKDQKNAIRVRNKRVLVSAAAGSGKTAVLVERIIERILDREDPVEVDELLVMTFTKAAAAQMKERIYQRVEEAIFQYPRGSEPYERLKRQAALIEHARIMTIDSFCLSLIREHIDKLNIDPAFRIASEGEIRMLRAETAKEVLEESYAEKNPRFIRFADAFAKTRNDIRLSELIESVFDFAQASPWPEDLLDELSKEYEKKEEDRAWERYIVGEIKAAARETKNSIEQALLLCEEPGGPQAYRKTFLYEKEQVQAIADAKDFEEIRRRLLSFSFSNIGRASKDTDELLKEKAKRIREHYKKQIKDDLMKNFAANGEKMEKELAAEQETVFALLALTRRFAALFGEKKLEKNIVDFNDLEHFALEILWTKEGGERRRSEAALEYREMLKEIYVDEYQDSNEVQEELIRAVEKGNVFMVGDVKQSIYAFRQAKPSLFIQKYREYEAFRDEAGQAGENVRIGLRQNFRSRKNVLHAINEVFFRIMSAGLGGIAYDEEAALYPGREFEEMEKEGRGSAKRPELLLCSCDDPDQDENRRETEARLIARRIRELMSEEGGLLVEDPEEGGCRPLRYSDIVILFRAMSGWAETFVDILAQEGIPAYAQTSSGYFDTAEIRLILALLAVIDNPYQDIEFTAFLHAPFVDIDENELARMLSFFRKNREQGTKHIHLCEVVEYLLASPEAAAELSPALLAKLKTATDSLLRWRKRSRQMKLEELLREIYNETNYLDYVSALQSGETRRANLMMLLDKAAEYGDGGYKGLFHFILYIDKLRKFNTDYGEASVLGETDDTVRIMSIHKSKGLEFPVCIIGAMGKQFNMSDLRSPIILDEELGIGCDYVDSEKRIKWSSIKKNTIKHRKRSEALGEELRVLYVGMSRAKEKLIMSAAVKDANETLEKYLQVEGGKKEALPSSYVRGANSYLDWLMLCREGIEEAVDIRIYGQADLIREEEKKQTKALLLEEAFENLETIEDEEMRALIGKAYEHTADIELHTKMSVSELKALHPGEEILLPGLEPLYEVEREGKKLTEEPEVLKEAGREKKAPEKPALQDKSARGRAYHRVLELMDYAAVRDQKSLEDFLKRLQEEKRLSEEERTLVKTSDLLRWLRSDLGRSFQKAYEEGRLGRELRFIMGVPADELGLAQSKESILVQGIIDAYIEYEDSVIIVDYKTDRVEDGQELRLRYAKQLEYYEKALQRILKKPVRGKYIWSFALHDTITC